MKLSELNPEDVQLAHNDSGLKLSNLSPGDVHADISGKDLINQNPDEQYSKLDSAGRGAIQGATFGFGDEITGGIQGAGHKLFGSDPEKNASLADLYRQYRDIQRQKNQAAEQQNPGSYLVGNIGGGLATSLVAGPEALAAKAGLTGVKAAAATGTFLGATNGLGTSDADLTQGDVAGAAKDTAIGAGIGGIAGSIGGKIANKLTPENAEVAATKAGTKAMGGKPSQELNTVWQNESGKWVPQKGSDVVKGIGKTALDEGVLPLTGGPDKMLDNLYSAIEKNESRLDPLLEVAQSHITPETVDATGDVGNKVTNMMNDYIGKIPRANQDRVKESIEKLEQLYAGDLRQADGNLTALNSLKREIQQDAKALQKNVFTNPDASYQADFLKRMSGVVNGHIQDLANNATESYGGNIGDQIRGINKTLGNLYSSEDLLTKLTNKSGSSVGVKDAATAGAGMLVGGPLGAVVAEGGKLAIEAGTGNSLSRLGQLGYAKTMNSVAKQTPVGKLIQVASKAPVVNNPFIMKTAQNFSGSNEPAPITNRATLLSSNLYNATDDSLQKVAQNLQKDPSAKFIGKSLSDAIQQNDTSAKNRAVYVIMQNPNIRKLITPDGEGQVK